MTKIIDLPTTTSTDVNTVVPVYQNGKTKKVSATAFGGSGSGSLSSDFTSLSTVPSVDGTEVIAVNKPLGAALRTTVQSILNWILARANTWSASQTINANLNFTGTGRRITGDFSNATFTNRVIVQTSVENGSTGFVVVPNGTGTASSLEARSISGETGGSNIRVGVNSGVDSRITAGSTAGGTFLPMTFHTNDAERLRIDTSGNILATGGSLGYGTGAGGTVTQVTSKSTSVALNKPSGRITMASDTLAAGASVVFVITNNLVSNSDGAVVGLNGNVTNTSNYRVEFVGCLTGLIVVKLTNVASGPLADAVQINFQVLKGSTS